MIKTVLLFFFMPISGIMLAQSIDSIKCWSNQDKLTWNDFKGNVPDNTNMHAATSYTLNALPEGNNDQLSYRITLTFNKYESWTTDTVSQSMLLHEQLHFDIAELYARKLRKTIRNIIWSIKKPTRNDFQPVIRRLYDENAKIQGQCDEETIHGADVEAQKRWTRKVHLELEQFKDYISTLEDCKSSH